ncbi:MAG: S41 family peptidase [Nitrospinota bacterium]|nr:MAG: S41 family peptidase [Nitrospinota bacterium]
MRGRRIGFVLILLAALLFSLPAGANDRWQEENAYPYTLAEVTRTIDRLYYDPGRLDYARMFKEAVSRVRYSLPPGTLTLSETPEALVVRFPQSESRYPLAPLADYGNFLHSLQAFYTQAGRELSLPFSLKHLEYLLIKGLMQPLDVHSSFLTPPEFREMQEENWGSFSGIGIRIGVRGGQLTILETIPDTPAARAGLQAGDRILKIDGQPTKNLTVSEAVSRIRGPRGTRVTLTIVREGEPFPRDFPLIRELVTLTTVTSTLLEGEIGHVRLQSFYRQTAEELETALERLQHEGMKGLILDLRDNPGGLLNQSVKVTELFVEEGNLIVFTQGRAPTQNLRFVAKHEGRFHTLPLVVLVNGGSASAAEIVTAALLDLRRAVVLGTKTFGKGSVQTIIPLHDGSGLRLTTAQYFTPAGKSVDHTGITPDYEIPHRLGSDVQLEAATRVLREALRLAETSKRGEKDGKGIQHLLRQVVALEKASLLPGPTDHSPLPLLRCVYQLIDANDNGVLDAGEQDSLYLEVTNAGRAPAKNVRAFFLSDHPLFPFQKLLLGDILQGETKTIQIPLSIPWEVQDTLLTIIGKVAEEGGYASAPVLLEFPLKGL